MPDIGSETLEAAHRHCLRQREELAAGGLCGCFFCQAAFAPADVMEWIEDGQTALCPRCQIDAVLADSSGFPVNEADFLKAMHEYWFERGFTWS